MSNKFKYNVTKVDELYPKINKSSTAATKLASSTDLNKSNDYSFELVQKSAKSVSTGYDKIFKQCSSCYDWKSLNEYHKFYGGFLGLKPECKVCNSKHSKASDPKRKYTRTDFYEYRDLIRKGKIFEGHRQLKILEAFDPVI